MDNNSRLIYEVIGKIQKRVVSNGKLEDTLQECFSILIEYLNVENIICWYFNEKEDKFHPLYFMSNYDFTKLRYGINDRIIGKVFKNNISDILNDYVKGTDEQLENIFEENEIEQIITIPLHTKINKYGCLQFINTKAKGKLTDEEIDTLEILSIMIAITLDDNPNILFKAYEQKTIIAIKNLYKIYKDGDSTLNALDGVNLEIYEGEFIVILGESGCGKSTLLNVIGGLISPSKGEAIYFNDDKTLNFTKATDDELCVYRRKTIGYIFQSYYLMPNINIYQNVELISELVDNPNDIMQMLKNVNLEDKSMAMPAKLSGGQQQRVAIARAMVKKPKILLADEPTAALDYNNSIAILSIFREMVKNENVTLVMVTHNEEIARMADRVIKMSKGKIKEIRTNLCPANANDLSW